MPAKAGAALLALLLCGCAARAMPPGAFAFGVMGDTPYGEAEEAAFAAMLEQAGREDLAFVVHVGDFKGGGACSDALYARRRAQFDASAHPLVYTPGDNEWVDCPRADPLERLARLRAEFFTAPGPLGRRPLAAQAQDACLAPPAAGCGCGALPENRAWRVAGVQFVTLHVTGSDNNTGRDARNDLEARCRDEANKRWLSQAAAAEDTRALVVVLHANPWRTTGRTFDGLLAQLEQAGRRPSRPVLLVHGDTHTYRVDYPFANVTRLETYGSPFVGWVKVTVDPASARVFAFESKPLRLVLPR